MSWPWWFWEIRLLYLVPCSILSSLDAIDHLWDLLVSVDGLLLAVLPLIESLEMRLVVVHGRFRIVRELRRAI
jgi:hypothetical protein